MKITCRKAILQTSFCLLVVMLASCGRRSSYQNVRGVVWNTTYSITYNSPLPLADSVIAVMKQVEMSLSPFNDSSLISRVNRGENPPVDSLLRRVFTVSQEVNRVSGGAFDPSVAPLVNLWGFGYRNSGVEPTRAMIDSVLPSVGIADCRIDSTGRIVRKAPATELNFSAITKGYGCDLVGEMLRRNGCEDFMVEIGGEIALSGRNPHGEQWRIMIEAPVDNDTAVVHERMAVIERGAGGIATSGNYRNFKQTSSGRIWHTISPRSGRPAHTDLLSATVIAPDAMLADAFATACMAMSADSARAMLSKVDGVEALFVTLNPADSTYVVSTTPGFPELKK